MHQAQRTTSSNCRLKDPRKDFFFNMKIIECLLCPKYVVMRFLQSDESEGKLEIDKSKTKQTRYTGRVLGPGKIKDCSRKKK